MQKNTEKTGLTVGIIILVIAAIVFLIPILADAGLLPIKIDMMRGGYAIMTIGVFLAIVGGVTALVYGSRVRLLDRIFSGEKILAHWVYDEVQFERQEEKAFRNDLDEKRGLFIVTSVLILVIGGLVFIPSMISGDIESPMPLLFMYGLIPVLAFFAFVLPRISYNARQRQPKEAFISSEGLYLFGSLHPFKTFSQWLEKAELKEGKHPEIAFTIRYLTRVGIISFPTYEVLVPVPPGEVETAQKVVASFSN